MPCTAQKLFIAQIVKLVDMPFPEKVLQNDNLEFKKTIQQLQNDLEQQKIKVQNLAKSKSIIERELIQIKKAYHSFYQEEQTNPNAQKFELRLQFNDEDEKKYFVKKLSSMGRKYGINNLQTTLTLCLEYTIKNDRSLFGLKKVKDFFQKKLKKKVYTFLPSNNKSKKYV